MTQEEVDIVCDILRKIDDFHIVFDERIEDDKKLLLVTSNEVTFSRYVINSPLFSEAEKAEARETLTALVGDEDDDGSWAEDELGTVVYRAPDSE